VPPLSPGQDCPTICCSAAFFSKAGYAIRCIMPDGVEAMSYTVGRGPTRPERIPSPIFY